MIQVNELYYNYIKSNKLFSRKSNKNIYALKNINLNITTGDKRAFLGFNGAGKSTLLKNILGILYPTKGTVLINNINPHKKRIKLMNDIGVVWGQKTTLWWDIPVIQSYKTLKKIYQIDDTDYENNINLLNEKLQISDYWDKPVRKLSLGQRVKAEIMAALLHNPNILILDEPFIGLDFIAKRQIINILNDVIDSRHITLLLTSHNINDIQLLCNTITLLYKGEVLLNSSIESLLYGKRNVKEINIVKSSSNNILFNSKTNNHVKITKLSSNKYNINFDNNVLNYKNLLNEIFLLNKDIIDISMNGLSLETIINDIVCNKNSID